MAATAAAATAVPAATATTAAAEPSPRVSLSPAASAPVELVDGLAPKVRVPQTALLAATP